MAEKINNNLILEKTENPAVKNNGFFWRLFKKKEGGINQEKVYQILNKGLVFTMEDDLKEALRFKVMKLDLIPQKTTEKSLEQPEESFEKPLPTSLENGLLFEAKEDLQQDLKAQSPHQSSDSILPLQKRKEEIEKPGEKEFLPSFGKPFESRKSEQEGEVEKQKKKEGEAPEEQKPPGFIREDLSEKEDMEKSVFIGKKEEFVPSKAQLQKEILQVFDLLKAIPIKKKSSEEEKIKLIKDLQQQEINLGIILKQEEQIELQQREIENQEAMARQSAEKHQFEKQRWAIEKQREAIEQHKWSQQEEIEKLKMATGKISVFLRGIAEERKKLENRKDEIETVLAKVDFQEEKKDEKDAAEFHPIEVKEGPLESKSVSGEPVLPAQEKLTEEKESKEEEVSEDEKRVVEEIRSRARVKERELISQVLKQKIGEEKENMAVQARREKENEEREKKLQEIREKAQKERMQGETARLSGPFSKDEILKRLIRVSPQEEAEREKFLERVSGAQKPITKAKVKAAKDGVVFHPMIRKTSVSEKVAARVIILLFIISLAVGGYLLISGFMKEKWYVSFPFSLWYNKEEVEPQKQPQVTQLPEQPKPQEQPLPPEQPEQPEQPLPPEQLNPPPASLLSTAETEIFEFSTSTEVIPAFIQILQKEKAKDSFTQVLFQDFQTKEFLELSEFLNLFGVKIKSEFFQLLETEQPPATLLVYYSQKGPRLSFVAKIKEKENLQEVMLSWEETIIGDLSPLFFSLLGKELKFKTGFKTANVQQQKLRYVDSLENEFGICYVLAGDYFFFTTSGGAMLKLINGFVLEGKL